MDIQVDYRDSTSVAQKQKLIRIYQPATKRSNESQRFEKLWKNLSANFVDFLN